MALTPNDIKNAQRNAAKLFPSGPRATGGGTVNVPSGVSTPQQAAKSSAKMFPDSLANGPATPPQVPFTFSPTKNIGEQQEERITATGGTRTLSFNGQTTGALAFDADAATIKAALEALSTIGAGNIGVVGLESANEVQTVTLGASNTGGTFTLTFAGQTTVGIAYNAPASAVQSALVALSNIDTADLTVTGSAGGPYTVTFSGVYAGVNVPKMTATGSLTGGANTVTIATAGSRTYTNTYLFQGVFANKSVPTITVNTGALTGGTSTVVVTSESMEEIISRGKTRDALGGLARPASQVNNDTELFNQRKPRDIGDPLRIPGEDYKNYRQ